MQKTCKKCNRALDIENFYISYSCADMLDVKCKHCRSEEKKIKYQENKIKREKLMQELLKM